MTPKVAPPEASLTESPYPDSSSDSDILVQLYTDYWAQIRHLEDQRVAITNFILVVVSILVGFITQSSLTVTALPMTVFLAVLGIYGMLATLKLSERLRLHLAIASAWRKRIDELNPDAHILSLRQEVLEQHQQKSGILFNLHVHVIWVTLHFLVFLAGTIISFLIVV